MLTGEQAQHPCGRGFHEKAGRVNCFLRAAQKNLRRRPTGGATDVLRAGFSFLRKVFSFPPSLNRPASIRTLGGGQASGASWGSQFYKQVLPSRYRTGAPLPKGRSATTSQSPELGDGLHIHLGRSFLGWHEVSIPQRFVHFPGGPQPMQQDRQLARHGYHRPLLGIPAAALTQLPPPAF